jgi:glycerol-3-phosphate O-acyltransferase/dihydroxyacetone phosphate acyltransferase
LIAGFAVMALSTSVAIPDIDFQIVPCGMHYIHGHKFRSRAGVEFGAPIKIPRTLVDRYRNGEENKAASELTGIVYRSLKNIVLNDQDPSLLAVGMVLSARSSY